MTKPEVQASHKIVSFLTGACVAAVLLSGYALIQTQDAIDASVAEQRVIACSQVQNMCASARDLKK